MDEDQIIEYIKFPNKRVKNMEFESHRREVTDDSYQKYSPFNRSQKQKRTFRISRGRTPKRNKVIYQTYKHAPQVYDSISEQDMRYRESQMPDLLDNSEFESGSKYINRPPLPIKQEVISNISLPILNKVSVKDFQIEIEDILSSEVSNKKKLVSKIMQRINKSLILSIDSYVNFIRRENMDEKDNMIYDSILVDQNSNLSRSIDQGRVHNSNHVIEKWKEANPQFTLSNSNLSLLYKLMNSY